MFFGTKSRMPCRWLDAKRRNSSALAMELSIFCIDSLNQSDAYIRQ